MRAAGGFQQVKVALYTNERPTKQQNLNQKQG